MNRPASRSQLYALAVGLLVVTCTLAWYAVHRQQLAERRNELYRSAICGILATIPGDVPPAIGHGRKVFARHPGQCAPVPGATPRPSTIRVTINGKPSKIVVNPPPAPSGGGASSASTVAPRPSPTPTHSPRPHPTSSPSPRPTPSPSPSPSCSLQQPLHCLPV